MKSSKVAQMGLLIALAFVLSYLEGLLPLQLGIPGAKLGLANIVLLFAIVQFSEKDALMLTIVRTFLTGFTFGSIYSMAYSLSGGVLSTIFMALMHKSKKFSIIGISVTGGVIHNIGQLIVAMIVLKTLDLRFYLGFLILCGVLTGFLIGVISSVILKNIRTNC